MRKFLPDLWIALLLLALPLAFFAPVTLGGQTLLPADNLYQYAPFSGYRAEAGAPDTPHNSLLSDLVLENYVWKLFIRQTLAEGEVPLWSPYLFGGAPFLAAGQSSTLYPLSALYYALPLAQAYGWYTVVQLWLAGVFMYAFARALGQKRIGATVAAVTWQFSGFFIVSVVFPMIIGAAAWLPFLLLMVELTIRAQPLRGRPATLPWVALGAGGLGVMIFAGHVEITYYNLLVMGFYAAWRLLAEARGRWQATRDRRRAALTPDSSPTGRRESALRWLMIRAAWLAALVVLGVGVGAAQFVPLFELVSRNFRSGSATLEQILGWAYPLRHVLAFLMPNFYGNPAHHGYWDLFGSGWTPATVNAQGQAIDTIFWGIKNYVEGGAYLGILPMALAAYALIAAWFGRRSVGATHASPLQGISTPGAPYHAIFATLGAICLTFIFGLPTYAVLYTLLPGINQLHSPFRWVFPLTLCVAALAGFGADALARSRRRDDARSDDDGAGAQHASPLPDVSPKAVFADTWARRLGWALFWAGVALLAALLLSRVFFGQIEPLVDRVFRALALAETAFPDARAFYSYQFPNALFLGLFLMASGAVLRVSRCPIYLPKRLGGRPVWEVLAVSVIALDLMAASWGFNPAVDPKLLDFTPPAIAWLQERYAQEGPFRVMSYDAPGANTLNANIPWLFGLEDARGYDSIIPRQYTDYMALISPQFQLEYNRVAPLTTDSPESLDSPLLDALNVRYVATMEEITRPGWEVAFEDRGLRIYANTDALPRAYTLPESAAVYYGDETPFADLVQQIDPRRALLIYAPAQSDGCRADTCLVPTAPLPAAITHYGSREVFIDVTPDGPVWLVLADSHFPGWRAFVRPQGAADDAEREVPVELVNGNFRGVRLDPGDLAARYADSGVELPASWTVRFVYSPASFQVGAFLSFIAAVTILFGLGVWLWRTFVTGREEGEAGTMRRLAKNSVTPIVTNLFNKGIDFALAFVMLRILGPGDAGVYYYAIVVFQWFDILTNFGLNTYLTREVARDRSQAARYLLNTSALRLGLVALGIPLLVAFLLVRQTFVEPPLEIAGIAAMALFYVGLLPGTLNTGLSALFYAFEQAEVPAAIATVSTLARAVISLGVLILGWGVVGLAGASIVTNVITLIVLAQAARRLGSKQPSPQTPLPQGEGLQTNATPLLSRRERGTGGEGQVAGRIEPPLLRRMVGQSWPLMVNHLLATAFFKIDVILMEAINGPIMVGWYSTAYKWLDALNVIPAFLSAALLPVISRQAHEDPPALVRSFRLSVKLLVIVALPLAAVTTFIAETLIGVLGGPEYLPDGAIALQLMIWSIPIGWINSVTNYTLIALDQQRVLTWTFVGGVGFNVIANLLLLPQYGYRAAALLHILSEAVLLALFLVVMWRGLRGRVREEERRSAVNLGTLLWKPGAATAAMFGILAALWNVNGLLALAGAGSAYLLALLVLHPFDTTERARLAPLLPGRLRLRLGITPSPAEAGSSGRGRTP